MSRPKGADATGTPDGGRDDDRQRSNFNTEHKNTRTHGDQEQRRDDQRDDEQRQAGTPRQRSETGAPDDEQAPAAAHREHRLAATPVARRTHRHCAVRSDANNSESNRPPMRTPPCASFRSPRPSSHPRHAAGGGSISARAHATAACDQSEGNRKRREGKGQGRWRGEMHGGASLSLIAVAAPSAPRRVPAPVLLQPTIEFASGHDVTPGV